MRKKPIEYMAFFAFLVAMILMSRFNYLLFHSVAEIFSMIVCCGIFMFAWNTKDYTSNDFFLFLGIVYLPVVLIDLLHTLSYLGMGVFVGYGANLPTQLWIAARYTESILLLIAPLFLTRKIHPVAVFCVFIIIPILAIYAIFLGYFPTCFINNIGLTSFKKISEYIISFILIIACLHLKRHKDLLSNKTYVLLLLSIILTIVSELSFTFYVSVYGISNLIGHILKVISFYLIYDAVIAEGVKYPYVILSAREKALATALKEVKTLKGIIPICSYCKKIRDVEGHWKQIEEIITNNTYAQFSHGVCPECFQKYYDEEFENQ